MLFSTVVNLLHLAVFKIKPSLHSAYKSRREEVGFSIAAIYNELAGTELAVSRQMVKQTADSMRAIYDALGTPGRVILPGYDDCVGQELVCDSPACELLVQRGQ